MPMTNKEFAQVVAELDAACQTLLDKKGADYTKSGNRLDNFEVVASLLQGAPMDRTTVCAVYLLKQVISLCRYVRERTLESESLDSRFQDTRNYVALFYACVLATEKEREEIIAEIPSEQLRDICSQNWPRGDQS